MLSDGAITEARHIVNVNIRISSRKELCLYAIIFAEQP